MSPPSPSSPDIPKPLTEFTLFSSLPPEIQNEVWSHTLTTTLVPITWKDAKEAFTSPRPVPPILHSTRASRNVGLQHYKLSFAPSATSSSDLAGVYFSFKHDILFIDWEYDWAPAMWDTLELLPGWLEGKIRAEELARIETFRIGEYSLLEHASDYLKELEGFTGLKELEVLCKGWGGRRTLGEVGIEAFMGELEEGTKVWPRVRCLRERKGRGEVCEMHWWMDMWNERTERRWTVGWREALSRCLLMAHLQELYSV